MELFEFDYNKIDENESTNDQVKRYLTAQGIEWRYNGYFTLTAKIGGDWRIIKSRTLENGIKQIYVEGVI
jgi:hypothetical protein